MTNFERLTQSPEVLAAWLEKLAAVNTPWEKAFDKAFCAECQNQNCEQCQEEEYRVNPLWWLGLEAEGTITVLRKRPGEAPEIVQVGNALEDLQDAVGGYIESLTIAEDACVLCDEEGRLKRKPFNTSVCGADFCGTILVVGVDGEDFASLKDPECALRMLWPMRAGKE